MVAVVIFGLFLGLMLVGVPVIMAFGFSSLAGLFYAGFGKSLIGLYIFPQMIVEGVEAPDLLAIPFFVLAGNLMNAIGVTDRIVRMADAYVGHLKAGLAQVNVVASLFFGGITGSAVADCAAVSNLIVRAMWERGYPKAYAGALTAASSVIGPTMWPSVPLLIYSFSASVSVERVFLAGLGPGILIVAALMIYNRFVAVRYKVPLAKRAPLRRVLRASFDGVWAILAPVIIVGSITTGAATALEAGVIASVYVIALGLAYRALTIAKLVEALSETVLLTCTVLMIIGMSTVMAWLMSFHQIPQTLANEVLGLTEEKIIFLLGLIIFFLIIGTILEPIPAMVVLLPILLPLIDHFHIDRVHFGLILVYGLLLGIVTPPVGVALFIVARVGGIPFERLCVAILSLLIPLIVVLFMISLVPAFVLTIPDLLLGHQ